MHFRSVCRGITRRCFSTIQPNDNPRILITGSLGQIGTELTRSLRARYGVDNVIASDVKIPLKSFHASGPFLYTDVTDYHSLAAVAVEHGIDWIIHNSAVMSVIGENNPELAMAVNIEGARNVMKLGHSLGLRVFAPSTMGVFSPESGKIVSEDTILKPRTIYGVCKIFLEQLGTYYNRKYDLDFRCLRYPGIISHETLPGGGTTDYAIHMFYDALTHGRYVCPIAPNESLPMMYMSDCLKSTVDLLEADRHLLAQPVYNIASMSFTPESLAAEIRKHIPNFVIEYEINPIYQNIASSWPDEMDDSAARRDWGWQHEVDLSGLVEDMLDKISIRLDKGMDKDQSSTRKEPSFRA